MRIIGPDGNVVVDDPTRDASTVSDEEAWRAHDMATGHNFYNMAGRILKSGSLYPSRAPISDSDVTAPTIPQVGGGSVVGLGLQGTQQVQKMVQDSAQNRQQNAIKIRAFREQAMESEKDRAHTLKLNDLKAKNDAKEAQLNRNAQAKIEGDRLATQERIAAAGNQTDLTRTTVQGQNQLAAIKAENENTLAAIKARSGYDTFGDSRLGIWGRDPNDPTKSFQLVPPADDPDKVRLITNAEGAYLWTKPDGSTTPVMQAGEPETVPGYYSDITRPTQEPVRAMPKPQPGAWRTPGTMEHRDRTVQATARYMLDVNHMDPRLEPNVLGHKPTYMDALDLAEQDYESKYGAAGSPQSSETPGQPTVEKTVVERRVAQDGTKMVKYSDGTIGVE